MGTEARWRIVYENTPDPDDVVFTATQDNAQCIAQELTAANMENGGGTVEVVPVADRETRETHE